MTLVNEKGFLVQDGSDEMNIDCSYVFYVNNLNIFIIKFQHLKIGLSMFFLNVINIRIIT